MQRIQHYIDGRLVEPTDGKYLDNYEPATGKVYSLVPDGDEADVERAVAAAEQAFPKWSRTPATERFRVLMRIGDIVESRLDELARAETIDNGKPLSLARSVDMPRAALNFRHFASAILHAHSETHVTDGVALNYTLRQPRGICGLISPWNLPLYLLTWKVAPAIAFGNTAVAKPSEVTPMTAYLFSQICIEAGLPPGVLNIVHGLGAKVGSAITAHPKINTISFTGGTVTGREVARACAPLFKKVSLELGGKNPTIVFADADMEQTLPGTLRAAYANQGQVCLCGSRIFVERPAYDDFVKKFVEAASKLRVGDPLEQETQQGAMVSRAQLDKTGFYVDLAKKEGGDILCGGERPRDLPDRCREGYFFRPTVLTGLDVGCRVNREEIFGPVAAIIPFDREDEVVEFANSVDYGLAASVWTQNLPRAHRLAERLQSGTVWVNCWSVRDLRVPFGGVKQSGLGREGGEEAMRFYTEPKNVCLQVASG